MGQPKRKHSKQRSRKRRVQIVSKNLSLKEPDGTFVRPHRVNPESGQYRGRQVFDVEA